MAHDTYRRRIGLVPGSFKPYHRGHDAVVQLAAQECDGVHVLVSLVDRARKGELTIRGSDMETIWHELIEPTLPANVTVSYLRTVTPINWVWTALGSAAVDSNDVFVIYSDQDDLTKNFNERALKKYAGALLSSNRIELRPTPRTMSATAVRRAIEQGDFATFQAAMPTWMDAQRAWDLLTPQQRADEILLRVLVRETLA